MEQAEAYNRVLEYLKNRRFEYFGDPVDAIKPRVHVNEKERELLDLVRFSIINGYPLSQTDFEEAIDLVEAWKTISQ